MAKSSNHYILILCGGSGPRLWPLSRASKPKQFLKLFNNQSILQETINRFKKFIPTQNIFVISQKKYLYLLKKDIGKTLPLKNILTEPEKKNTAMAIIFGSAVIKKINPNAIITSTPSDHFVSDVKLFERDIVRAANLAQTKSKIVALGTVATSPNPAYGYILPKDNTFIEKPDESTALKFVKTGAYWNCGIYTFTLDTLVSELELHQPVYLSLFNKIFLNKLPLQKLYKVSPTLSFDVAISEKTNNLLLLAIKFSWSDIGEWKSIFQKLPKIENQNAKLNSDTKLVEYNSSRCLVSTTKGKLIGLVGVKNLAIIDTKDGLLVCNIDSEDSYHVRDIVSQIVDNPKLKKYFLK